MFRKMKWLEITGIHSSGRRGIFLPPTLADDAQVHFRIEGVISDGADADPIERPAFSGGPVVGREVRPATVEADSAGEDLSVPERLSVLIAFVVGAQIPVDPPAVVFVMLDAHVGRSAVRIEERVSIASRGRVIRYPAFLIVLDPRLSMGRRVDIQGRHFDGGCLLRRALSISTSAEKSPSMPSANPTPPPA